MRFTEAHLYHHGRFYWAVGVGLAVFALLSFLNGPQPVATAGDAFFLVYLFGALRVLMRHTAADVKRRAAREDEGILLVVAITLGVIVLNIVGVFAALGHGSHLDLPSMVVVLAAVPLGWFVLHTISAFHYANLHYFAPPGGDKPGKALAFPGTAEPDLWDFLYFSFVIGMTAQVSDVQIQTRDMRRAVSAHAIVSFFFNTVLIALVVNAVVSGH